jgi:hypothetical protein
VKGRVNPPSEWVWSPSVTHEPLTTRAYFDAASPVVRYRQGSRSKATNNAHPKTKRSYRYRPPALTVNEDIIDTFVARFFNERVFGVHRLDYLEGPTEQPIRSEAEATAAAHARQISELDAANKSLILSLQQMTSSGDPEIDAQWRTEIQLQFANNAKRKQILAAELQELAKAAQPKGQGPGNLWINYLMLTSTCSALPDEKQRQLFDAFQLEIRYDRHLQRITLRVAVRAEMVDVISQAAAEVTGKARTVPRQRQPERKRRVGADVSAPAPVSRSHVQRAPGRIRTCAPASGGRRRIGVATVLELRQRLRLKQATVQVRHVFGTVADWPFCSRRWT